MNLNILIPKITPKKKKNPKNAHAWKVSVSGVVDILIFEGCKFFQIRDIVHNVANLGSLSN